MVSQTDRNVYKFRTFGFPRIEILKRRAPFTNSWATCSVRGKAEIRSEPQIFGRDLAANKFLYQQKELSRNVYNGPVRLAEYSRVPGH